MMSVREKIQASSVNEQFGKKLATVRKLRGYSQTELARMVKLSRGTVSNIELGVQNVQMFQVYVFAHALNAPVADFLPLLKDVMTHDGKGEGSDRMFLELAKRQLIEINAMGDDDEKP